MLKVEKLTCGYGSNVVLHDINFDVEKGEIIGVIGPNGSGKTTLIRAITKVLKPMCGRILLKDRNTEEMSYRELAKNMAVVTQSVNTGGLSVEEFVIMGRIPYYSNMQFFEMHEDHEIADKYMGYTDILGIRNKALEKISTGEKQRAILARALSQEPQILLLDEPTAHLDITHQVAILDLIKKMNRNLKLTVIMVLHDLNLASEYCDRLILINKGRIYSDGRPEEVITYQNIEEVYKTVVVVNESPVSGRPQVLIVSEEVRNKSNEN